MKKTLDMVYWCEKWYIEQLMDTQASRKSRDRVKGQIIGTKAISSNMIHKSNVSYSTSFSYLVLFVSFILQALSMGFFISFGTIYVELIKIYQTTETSAAWIGSIAISVCFTFGILSSFLCERYGCGNIITLGGCLLGIGLLLTSIADTIFTLAVTFSGITSLGCSFLYFASLSILPHYFKEKNLCFATSIACCGISLSGMTFSPVMVYLINTYNFRTCFQLFSAVALFPMVSGILVQRYGIDDTKNYSNRRTKNSSLKGSFDCAILANKRLMLVILAMSLVELCYFTPYIHLVNFAMHNGISLTNASFLPVSLSLGSLGGKIIFALIGKIKQVNIIYLFQSFLLSMAVCLTLLPMATDYMHLILFSVVYGMFDGAFSGYIVPVVSKTVSPPKLGIALGLMYSILAVEICLGPPLAGFIYTSTNSYHIPFTLCGGIIIIATLLFFFIPFLPGEINEEKNEIKPLLGDTKSNPVIKICKRKEGRFNWINPINIHLETASVSLFEYGIFTKKYSSVDKFKNVESTLPVDNVDIIRHMSTEYDKNNESNSSENNRNNNTSIKQNNIYNILEEINTDNNEDSTQTNTQSKGETAEPRGKCLFRNTPIRIKNIRTHQNHATHHSTSESKRIAPFEVNAGKCSAISETYGTELPRSPEYTILNSSLHDDVHRIDSNLKNCTETQNYKISSKKYTCVDNNNNTSNNNYDVSNSVIYNKGPSNKGNSAANDNNCMETTATITTTRSFITANHHKDNITKSVFDNISHHFIREKEAPNTHSITKSYQEEMPHYEKTSKVKEHELHSVVNISDFSIIQSIEEEGNEGENTRKNRRKIDSIIIDQQDEKLISPLKYIQSIFFNSLLSLYGTQPQERFKDNTNPTYNVRLVC